MLSLLLGLSSLWSDEGSRGDGGVMLTGRLIVDAGFVGDEELFGDSSLFGF
jgi:hypothetical protein